jgi:urea transport system permease protein
MAAQAQASVPTAATVRGRIVRERLLLVGALALLALAPAVLSDFRLSLLAKFLAFAIVALSLDLVWGYGGILSLGHGVFFGLGAYAMAMYLKLEAAGDRLPDFMAWSGLSDLPWFWMPFSSPVFAIAMAIVVPLLLAALLGFLSFRSGIQGVYFSIVTQALALILSILLIGQQPFSGGTNGLTNFSTALGFPLIEQRVQVGLYYVALAGLAAAYLICRAITQSRFGLLLVALRDDPRRLRACGYNPVTVGMIAFAISAGLAGLAGAIFAPLVGIVSPAAVGVVPSIEMVIWVAIGGRGTLIGAILGALLVNAARSGLSESFPAIWQYFQGALFIGTVVLFKDGLVGFVRSGVDRLQRRLCSPRDEPDGGAAVPGAGIYEGMDA